MTGAAGVYFYFTYVNPAVATPTAGRLEDLGVFVALTASLVAGGTLLLRPYFAPVLRWRDALEAGADASTIPSAVRRRALNAPLIGAVASMTGWTVAGVFYFAYQRWFLGAGLEASLRTLFGIVLVGGPVASVLAFLAAELTWRRQIPLFFPDGHLDRAGVYRVPVLVRLGATFLVTAALPPLLMLMADFSLERRFAGVLPAELRPLWDGLIRTQVYIVGATGLASIAMALLVARFINRPLQALRAAMGQVAAGDLSARVPVRSTDELGELNEYFNATVTELGRAATARELFGRYVSRAVAERALDRGITAGGELVRATAMFVDLRGFTALSERLPPDRVVELLNEYYAVVSQACEQEGGIITQFLGDGAVAVFGGPLRPQPDHARRAVTAAIVLLRALATRTAPDGERLLAGIGICTGDMIAGNVGTGERVTYTIVGDAVNQAARLQVKTRDLDASILITASTRAAFGDAAGIVLRPCGAVSLKGIASPVEIFAVDA